MRFSAKSLRCCTVRLRQGGSASAGSRLQRFNGLTARSAFTLIEIMIVVAIMGMILLAGIPSLYRLMHKEGFRKTLSDIVEVCNDTRRDAIMNNRPSDFVLHPQDGTFEGAGKKGKIENASIELLEVNLLDYKSADVVHVRFFPNGTSDEMWLVLQSDKGEWCRIALEITTGMVMPLEYDPNKWR